MNGVPTVHWIAAGITALYGLVSITGGILGYVWANSVPSLVAGGIAGLLLLLSAAGMFWMPAVSQGAAIVIAILLLGRFVPKLIELRGELTEKGMVPLIMVIGGALVVVVSALALAMRSSPPNTP